MNNTVFVACTAAGGKEETGISTLPSQEGKMLVNFGASLPSIFTAKAGHPTIAHTVSEPAMTSADQPTSHSDVHRSRSTPGKLMMATL